MVLGRLLSGATLCVFPAYESLLNILCLADISFAHRVCNHMVLRKTIEWLKYHSAPFVVRRVLGLGLAKFHSNQHLQGYGSYLSMGKFLSLPISYIFG